MDLHREPFDEGTKVKLSLFRDYLREWLPVWLAGRTIFKKTINVFDFFAGPGCDVTGAPGSPLIILDELTPYKDKIRDNKLLVHVYLNDSDPGKVESLTQAIEAYAPDIPCKLTLTCADFAHAFPSALPLLQDTTAANFLFLDQNGIKHITKDVFDALVSLSATDFLFFISSSTINRFCENDEIQKYVGMSPDEARAGCYCDIHRRVCDYYRSLIPSEVRFYLAPFTIKKGANVYGLIFGSRHVLGIMKFLGRCWQQDPERGEANFDIDGDCLTPEQPALFAEMNKPQKLDRFETQLLDAVSAGTLSTNHEIIEFGIQKGFLPKHSRPVIANMMRDGSLPKQAVTLSYDAMRTPPTTISR